MAAQVCRTVRWLSRDWLESCEANTRQRFTTTGEGEGGEAHNWQKISRINLKGKHTDPGFTYKTTKEMHGVMFDTQISLEIGPDFH